MNYRGTHIHGQRLDLLVANSVVVEIKATARLDPICQAKLISYLRTTVLRVGLLINFNTALLKEGLKRVVLSEVCFLSGLALRALRDLRDLRGYAS